MRHTSSHTKNRRSHHALKNQNILKTENGGTRLPHRLDESTGMYRGKQIVEKKEVKAKAKDHDKRVEAHKHDDVAGDKVPVQVEENTQKVSKNTGLLGKVGQKGKAKSRSGMGGGA